MSAVAWLRLVLAFAPKGAVVMDTASVFRNFLDILWVRICLGRNRGFIPGP